jgi:hypothetical protein
MAALAVLRHRSAAHGGRSHDGADARFPVLVPEDHMRPLWEGLNESRMTERQRGMVLRVLLSRMRHDGCGGRAGRAELLTGIDGVSSRPVRWIVLLAG